MPARHDQLAWSMVSARSTASSITSSGVMRSTDPPSRNVDSSSSVPAFSVARAAGLT